MQHVVAVFTEHSLAAASGHAGMSVDLARRMDGAMLIVGALVDVLKIKVSPHRPPMSLARHQGSSMRPTTMSQLAVASRLICFW